MDLFDNTESLELSAKCVNSSITSESYALTVSTQEQLGILDLLLDLVKWWAEIGGVEVFIPYSVMPLIVLVTLYLSIDWYSAASNEPITQDEDENEQVPEMFGDLSAEMQRLEDRVAGVERARDRLGAGDNGDGYDELDRFTKEFSKLQERLSRVEEQCDKLNREPVKKKLFDEDEEMGLNCPRAAERGDAQSWLLEQRLEATVSQMRSESAHSVALKQELHALRNSLEAARKQRQSILREFKTLMSDVGLERTLTSDAIRDVVSQLKKMPNCVRALKIAVGVLETIHTHISFGHHLRLRRVTSFLSKYDVRGEEDSRMAFSATF